MFLVTVLNILKIKAFLSYKIGSYKKNECTAGEALEGITIHPTDPGLNSAKIKAVIEEIQALRKDKVLSIHHHCTP